jgi:hypothetical protein
MEVTQLRTHNSCVCAGTWDCRKIVLLSASTPGEKKRHEFKRPSLKISRVLRHRDSVKIRQHEKRLVGRLQIHPVFQSADVVADHQRSSRLNPAQH